VTAKRIAGIVLLLVGLVALAYGGIFWTDRDTVIDAGPVEVTTADREGVPISPVLGAIAIVGGIVLLVLPDRRKVL
jgi:hypothetical protein